MADSTYLTNTVEPFIVQWVSRRIGVALQPRLFPVGQRTDGTPVNFEFDGVSEDGQTGLLVSTSRSLKTGAVRKLHEDAAIWWAKNTNVVRTRTGISSRCSLARLAMLPGTDLTILVNTRAPAPLRLGRI